MYLYSFHIKVNKHDQPLLLLRVLLNEIFFGGQFYRHALSLLPPHFFSKTCFGFNPRWADVNEQKLTRVLPKADRENFLVRAVLSCESNAAKTGYLKR